MKSVATSAISSANEAFTYASNTAGAIHSRNVAMATDAIQFASNTANAVKDRAVANTTDALTFASNTVTAVRDRATTTITTLTPSPVLDLIQSTVANAEKLRADPVGTIKPYVPAVVIQTGEKTYEVVKESTELASGFIVTKVSIIIIIIIIIYML